MCTSPLLQNWMWTSKHPVETSCSFAAEDDAELVSKGQGPAVKSTKGVGDSETGPSPPDTAPQFEVIRAIMLDGSPLPTARGD